MFVVIGTTNADLIVSGMERWPRGEGDEFTASSLVFCDEPLAMILGGNGGNSAYVLARLGAPVALASAIGTDPLGDTLAAWLADVGVEMGALVRSAAHATASTTILVDPAEHRLSFHHPGASWAFEAADVRSDLIEQADVLLASSYPLLKRWRPDGFRQVLASAHRHGATTALDIGPAIGEPATLDELAPLLPDVDYLIANAYELAVCTGTDRVEEGMARALEAGAACVVVKKGKAGTVRADKAEAEAVPGFPVEARTTVGAGDAFNAGFLFGIREDWGLSRSVRFGNATAALVVSAAQGVLGAPDRAHVQALLDE
ncbi:MAG: carbohydrate kinase family protein [Rhodothermales bacterium]